MTALLRRGLGETTRANEIVDYPGEREAIEAAMASLRPEELLLIGTEEIETALAVARALTADGRPSPMERAAG